MKSLAQIKMNYNLDCSQIHNLLMSSPKLLKWIMGSENIENIMDVWMKFIQNSIKDFLVLFTCFCKMSDPSECFFKSDFLWFKQIIIYFGTLSFAFLFFLTFDAKNIHSPCPSEMCLRTGSSDNLSTSASHFSSHSPITPASEQMDKSK